MVDLNFLLITFFMLTTSLAEPKAMELQMPYKPSKDPTILRETSAITLVPSADHKVFYYEGIPQQPIRYNTVLLGNGSGLRSVLIRKQQKLSGMAIPGQRAIQVIIKPDVAATFDDLIQVLDEMKILNIRCYMIADISVDEVAALNAPKVRTR